MSEGKIGEATGSPVVKCEDVRLEMGDGSYERDLGWWEGGGIGSLIWNPKGGEGHVLVREEKCTQSDWGNLGGLIYNCGCDGFLGKCDNMVSICECGEDNSYRDHHYALLRRAALDTGEPPGSPPVSGFDVANRDAAGGV